MPSSVHDLEQAGSFALGPWRVRRIGYGAMQLAGDGVFGPPRDRDEALRVLRAAVDSGVDRPRAEHPAHPGNADAEAPGGEPAGCHRASR